MDKKGGSIGQQMDFWFKRTGREREGGLDRTGRSRNGVLVQEGHEKDKKVRSKWTGRQEGGF